MARFSVSGRATIAGTSALPLVSLYATAAVRPNIVEIGLFNTTATEACVAAGAADDRRHAGRRTDGGPGGLAGPHGDRDGVCGSYGGPDDRR